jgi:Fe2+ transport system protein FeoA
LTSPGPLKLAELSIGAEASVTRVAGSGSFRRRLLELGVLPGTRVEVVGIAPLGDPIELLVRGSSLSIRRAEASLVEVAPAASRQPALTSKAAVFGGEVLERGER